MKTKLLISFLTFLPLISTAGVEDLLISEIVVTPTDGEFIEIYNNGATDIVLTDVYITDATLSATGQYYYNITTGADFGGALSSSSDFHAQFPNGAMIASGEYQTIALNGSTLFASYYGGLIPTYEMFDDGDTMVSQVMLPVDVGSNALTSGLSNSGEVVVLYAWDGNADLVSDIDYVLWGDKAELVDKTGVGIDGPDGDITKTSYLNDTSFANQDVIDTVSHAFGNGWQRVDFNEGTQNQTTGNGIGNNSDETSENLSVTFTEGTPTPVGIIPPPTAPNIIINEVDAVGSAEFVEIKGPVGASLDDVTLVFFEGVNDSIYKILDLSGNVIANGGYFLVSDAVGSADMVLGGNINDDASAVAIYFKNETNFNKDDLINDPDFVNDIIDAMVYHSGTPDEGGLLALLNASEPQVDENMNMAAATESNARCGDGQGGKLNTSTYKQVPPTAGTINNMCPVGDYYANADPTTPATLRTTLHDIIKDHVSYPYSNGSPNTWEILSFADEDHNAAVDLSNIVAEKVWMIYKNISYTYNGGGTQVYNREHTWPQSYGFKNNVPDQDTNNAPRTDAHHLMMSDKDYNNNRSSKYYDNCNPANDNTCVNTYTPTSNPPSLQTTEYDGDGDGMTEGGDTGSTYPGNSNWTNNTVFEVWHFRKGDIARAMFYMDVRYEGQGEVDITGTVEPDLVLTDTTSLIQGTSGSPAYMGKLSTLLQWHKDDPVDDIERERNEVVFSYQTNRNPFIDHPEWVACIFENDCAPADLMFANGFEN